MELLPFLMLPAAFALMFLGVQVMFSMMITAVLFGLVVFGDKVIHQFIEKIDDLAEFDPWVFVESLLEHKE